MAVSENQCERMQDLLSLFVDGRLAPADVARVEAHVARCTDCASYLGFLRATSFVIANRLPDVRPPADLYARIAQMTYERPAQPTWSQRLSRLLAPAPTRWALGTALAAAGIVGVAMLPQRTNNQGVDGHSAVAVASPKPDKPANFNTRKSAQSMVATMAHPAHPVLKANTPVAASHQQIAVVTPDLTTNKHTVTPRRIKAPESEAPVIAVTLPTPAKHTASPSIPAVKPAMHLPDNAPHLAMAKNPVVPVAHDALAESVRRTLREQEKRQKEQDTRTLASREMGIGQRKAASEAHANTIESVTPRVIPVESSSNAGTTSAPATIAIPAPVPIRVAEMSASPRRITLASVGFDEGQKPKKYTLPGINSNHHAPVKADGIISVVSDN